MAEEAKEVKVPEGVDIKQPKPERPQRSGLTIPEFSVDASLPNICYPHYTNNARDQLSCVLIRPDGMAMIEQNIPRDEKHPLYRDIKRQFTDQEIDHNTQREIAIQQAKAKDAELKTKDENRERRRAELWARKSTFLDLDIVKNTQHKNLKRKLRQATNPEEALAYGVAIIIKESEKDGE